MKLFSSIAAVAALAITGTTICDAAVAKPTVHGNQAINSATLKRENDMNRFFTAPQTGSLVEDNVWDASKVSFSTEINLGPKTPFRTDISVLTPGMIFATESINLFDETNTAVTQTLGKAGL